jgi:hypothetical protein
MHRNCNLAVAKLLEDDLGALIDIIYFYCG